LNSRTRLSRAVDPEHDHILGPEQAQITLVEYGSYACPHCRAANERITEVRELLGERLRYVFRHKPLQGNNLATPAAELAECTRSPAQFWETHVTLMTRSHDLTQEDLEQVSNVIGLDQLDASELQRVREQASVRVTEDVDSAQASGVMYTPTFFINGRRYDGPWDESSFIDAMLGTLGHRVRSAALSFARWAPSTGLLLLLATLLAIAISNSSLHSTFNAIWETEFGLSLGNVAFQMPLLDWINDALLTIFFLLVGLEIKREFTVGHLASRRAAMLPIAAAVGGMLLPALLYAVIIPPGPWTNGWGVPMATDTAFAIALIAIMGARVPVELRIFLTAAAIVDDIGAIIVVAIFYSGDLHFAYLACAALATLGLVLLNKFKIYRLMPYMLLGVLLWVCVHGSGLHATLAGVILALLIPTRPPPHYKTLALQADAILAAEAQHSGEQYRHGPSATAFEALDAIHNRLESPADRLLRVIAPRSSYVVLPLFALANAGVVMATQNYFSGQHDQLALAILLGLVLGKPLGFVSASYLAVRTGLAQKPDAYSWRQLAGAGALAGIGFTMSLFIAGQAFPLATDFTVAKMTVFLASVLSSIVGVLVLWGASPPQNP